MAGIETVECFYKGKCSDEGAQCNVCLNNKGKRSHFTPDIVDPPCVPYVPYYPPYPYYPWYPNPVWTYTTMTTSPPRDNIT